VAAAAAAAGGGSWSWGAVAQPTSDTAGLPYECADRPSCGHPSCGAPGGCASDAKGCGAEGGGAEGCRGNAMMGGSMGWEADNVAAAALCAAHQPALLEAPLGTPVERKGQAS
jgi:hypothetical protein